jgi:hypothetical protein
MSVPQVGTEAPAAHRAALLVAEQQYQQAIASTPTQAIVRAADLARARAVRASCIANNNSSGVEQAVVMLKELGAGGS